MAATLAARVLAALPQTQCRRCSYSDCAAYAHAIAQGEAAINQCPPGGALGVQRLSALTAQPVLALNPACGIEGPRSVAFIDEAWCIGCTLCIKICPTGAIVGANKLMHTVMEGTCTGCELCLPVCPVDCILLENVSGDLTGWAAWSPEQAGLARQRYEQTQKRHQCEQAADRAPAASKRATVEAALTRARLKRKSAKDGAQIPSRGETG